MSDTGSLKVYELAKELGVDSISLIDKLKGLKIQVKSHMSSLPASDVEKARESLATKTTKAKKKTSKKKVVKKKAAVSKTTKKKVVKKKAAASEPETPTEESSEKKASPIIRRRRSTSGDSETVSRKILRNTEATAEEPQEIETQSIQTPHEEKLEAVETPTEKPIVSEVQEEPAVVEKVEAKSPPKEKKAPVAKKTATAVEKKPAPKPAKSFLKISKLDAPQKPNIVSYEKPSKSDPAASAADARKKNFKVLKMNKEALDRLAEEESSKKKGTGGGGGRDQVRRPEDTKFADYRKKEMVFLPRKKRIPVGKSIKQTQITMPAAHKRVVEMNKEITVQELANQLNIKGGELIRKLIGMGQMVNLHASLDFDTASLICDEYRYEIKDTGFKEDQLIDITPQDPEEDLVSRPPIVTVMGHVDHGKTSLLDAIKNSNVADKEAGGITQHIGAYTVTKDGKEITFIDTPGHAAFSLMRARGANVTDIVILVCAGDDGVMPQTIEAASHAKAAGAPIIVAVNKMDKEGASMEKVYAGMGEIEIVPEEWGGETMFIPCSALKGDGIQEILEAVLLNAEMLELKANPKANASGSVLEARLEKGRGPVMSVVVQRGTLKKGDAIVCGHHSGKVKAMTDWKGRSVKEVKPGEAVEILGLEGVPSAGEKFQVAKNETDARKIIAHRKEEEEREKLKSGSKINLDNLFEKLQQGGSKDLNIVLKADVFGSVEAVKDSLIKLSTDKVKVKVIHAAAGGITESDVLLASASNAIIIGFNVRPETKARQIAESEGIDVKTYPIIYELLDDVKKAMTGLLDKKEVEKFLGRAEVRETFSVPKVGVIAGSSVVDGKIVRGAKVRLLRDSVIVYEGTMNSLKRFKDDAKEVQSGYECGIGLENFNDVKIGDLIEAYEIEYIQQEL